MIEEALMNYGVLGLWTISLLIQNYKVNAKLQESIEELTKVISEKL